MNIIFFSRREGRARHFNLAHPVADSVCALAGIAVLGGALAAAGAKLLKDRDATSEKPDPEGDGGTE